jgi:hypothetical protein
MAANNNNNNAGGGRQGNNNQMNEHVEFSVRPRRVSPCMGLLCGPVCTVCIVLYE